MIKKPELKEVDAIVDLHLNSLKDGLLYLLGKDILKIVYNEIFNDKDSFILASYNNDKITGIAASTKDAEFFFNKVKKNNLLNIAWAALIKSFKKPIIPLKIIFSKHPSVIKSELLFLFVDKGCRGQRIGEKLVKATSKQFARGGIKSYVITILSSNLRGKKFYERVGFKKVGQYKSSGENMDIYNYKIKSNE